MAAGIYQARIKWYFNTPEMMRRLGQWRHDTLSRVGAYGRGVMMNKLNRPQLKQNRERTVTFVGTRNFRGRAVTGLIECFVPHSGPVVDAKTGRPVSRDDANHARILAYANLKGKGVGKPPRRGPTGKLRRFTDFSLDPKTESVVIGSIPFTKQPSMVGTVSVPQLLNEGGTEMIAAMGGSVAVLYGPRPYVEPTLPPTAKKLNQLIKQRPVGR